MSKLTIIFFKECAMVFFLILFYIDVSIAAPPPLRDEVLLNGTWSFTPRGGSATSITIPGYWNESGFTGTKRATYTRDVTVPSAWAGKIIKLDFEGVMHVADVYVKNKKSLKRYWPAPFSLFAFGFISSTVFSALFDAFANWPERFDLNPFFTMSFIGYTFTGIMIALSGLIIYHYVKEINEIEGKKPEIEKKMIKTP